VLLTRLLAIVIGCLLIGLTPLAYATPPDPLWISGYWDDDDFDDVVVAVLNSSAVQPESAISMQPLWVPVASIELPGPDAMPAPTDPASYSRAPPVVFSPPAS
jgi:hypothetical protein